MFWQYLRSYAGEATTHMPRHSTAFLSRTWEDEQQACPLTAERVFPEREKYQSSLVRPTARRILGGYQQTYLFDKANQELDNASQGTLLEISFCT